MLLQGGEERTPQQKGAPRPKNPTAHTLLLLYQKEGYTRPSTLGRRRPTGRPPLPSP